MKLKIKRIGALLLCFATIAGFSQNAFAKLTVIDSGSLDIGDMGEMDVVVMDGFADVKGSDWYYDDVTYVCDNKLMTGIGNSMFSPDSTLTRAMMITILYRLNGDNATRENGSFDDVEKGSWYENAVNWGFEKGIVSGLDNKTFAPMSNLTREQLCVMLYNYTKFTLKDAVSADISGYSDSTAVSDWAKDAVSWAVGAGILSGKDNNSLAPADSATRAETAAVIRRYAEKFAGIEEN